MPGLAGMDEEGRGAGGGQGRGDLAPDVPGLAHAGGHHPPAAGKRQLAGAGKLAIDPGSDRRQGLALDFQHAAATGHQAGRLGVLGGQDGGGGRGLVHAGSVRAGRIG